MSDNDRLVELGLDIIPAEPDDTGFTNAVTESLAGAANPAARRISSPSPAAAAQGSWRDPLSRRVFETPAKPGCCWCP